MSAFTRAWASVWLLAVAASAAAQGAPSPSPVATIRVTYVEVAPSEVAGTATVLKTYRQATQQAPGVAHVEVVQQIGRPNFFVIHEKWNDERSLQEHIASAENTTLRDNLRRALLSPLDERLLAPISAAPARGTVSNQAVYVVTHADAAVQREAVPGMLQALAAAARQENGNVLFDVTVQSNRTNHFTVIEVWGDQKAYDAHVTAENTRNFRTAFASITGALYDERVYKRIP